MTFTRNVMVDIIGEDCNSEIGVSEVAYSQNELQNTFILAESEITYKANLMSEGFFKVPRKITDDPRYRSAPLKYKHVLLTILQYACFKPTYFSIGEERILLQPGQLCTTHRHLAELCNKDVIIAEDKVDKNISARAIAYFTSRKMVRHEVRQKARHSKTIITILFLDSCKENKNASEPASEAISEAILRQKRGSKEEIEERKEVNNCNSLRSLQYAGSSAQKRNRSPAVEQKGIFFSAETQGFQGVTDEDINAWKIAFPLVDLQKETAAAAQWVLSNPSRKKTLWRRFLTNWFSKAQSYAENKAYSGAARALPVDRRQRDAAGNPIKVRSDF